MVSKGADGFQQPVCVELEKSARIFRRGQQSALKEERVGVLIVKQLKDFDTILTEAKGKRS